MEQERSQLLYRLEERGAVDSLPRSDGDGAEASPGQPKAMEPLTTGREPVSIPSLLSKGQVDKSRKDKCGFLNLSGTLFEEEVGETRLEDTASAQEVHTLRQQLWYHFLHKISECLRNSS